MINDGNLLTKRVSFPQWEVVLCYIQIFLLSLHIENLRIINIK